MEIKDGFANKKMSLKFVGRTDGTAELYINQEGLPTQKETLSYLTLQEMFELQKEIHETIIKMVTPSAMELI